MSWHPCNMHGLIWKQTSQEPISLNSNCLLQADLWFRETIKSLIGSISSNFATCYAEVLRVKGLLCWCCSCFTHSTRWTQAKYVPACSDQDVYETKGNHMQSKRCFFLATNNIQRSTWRHSMLKIGLTIWLCLEAWSPSNRSIFSTSHSSANLARFILARKWNHLLLRSFDVMSHELQCRCLHEACWAKWPLALMVLKCNNTGIWDT